MENMSPAQRHACPDRASHSADSGGTGGLPGTKRRINSNSQRRQSAPSLVLTKALTRSKTISRESFQVPVCPETCPLIQSYLACPDRSFLLHGHAQLKTGLQTQERHLFLFSDTLLVTKAKSVNHFKLKAQVKLSELWVGGCMEEVCEGSTAPERGFVMGWPTCNCVATFSSSEQKEKWLSLLKSRMQEEKERDETKTIALRVHGKGLNTLAHAKTLPVSNSDPTNEVIRLALQQFGIAGNVKDYQLWVISKRDNTPYPLIGHEFPFSIHMHHLRDAPSRDTAASCDRQGALQPAPPPPRGKQCQFVMKMRPVATAHCQASAESSHRHFKRRRSLINWAFWRGPAHQFNDPASDPGPRGDGCLFGQPLSSLCSEDVPKPIMDMLFFLYHEGSWTRGIFRRSAGARAVRELRDSLDAGLSELPLTCDHVFIIAGVFKEFLRNIPGSLLCSELYEDWAEVVEEDEEEEEEKDEGEQVQAIQRLIGRLPAANAGLLRYVASLLHGIQGNAGHNQMTSFNLSVCIAPSMLWAPRPSSPEQEGRGAKTVCDLVRFIIDHCQQIMGQAPSAVFGGPPRRQSNEDAPTEEAWSCHMTDSSYDSLENELDDTSSGGGTPSLGRRPAVRPHRSHGDPLRGSLDSILTLSDLDPDGDATPPPALLLLAAAAAAAVAASPASPGHGSRRRRSEPAVAYAAKLASSEPHVQGEFKSPAEGGGASHSDDDEEEPPDGGGPLLVPQSPGGGGHDRRRSTPDSRLPATGSPEPRASPRSPLETLRDWTRRPPPRGPQPREPLSWGTLKGTSQGLHPNSWLKKARRLSLTQQDPGPERPGSDGEERKRSGTKSSIYGAGRPGLARPGEGPPPSHHRSTGSLHIPGSSAGNDFAVSSPPQPLVLPGATLSLFRHQRPGRGVTADTSRPPAERQPRRSSEPGPPQTPGFHPHPQQGVKTPAAAAAMGQRQRPESPRTESLPVAPPRDPGLEVSDEEDREGGLREDLSTCSCLSPGAVGTGGFRDTESGQQGVSPLVRGRAQWWRRRHSSAMAEQDFDQLLFSEESYV